MTTTTFIKANKGRSNTKWSPLADYSLLGTFSNLMHYRIEKLKRLNWQSGRHFNRNS